MICSRDGCDLEAKARSHGLCGVHWKKAKLEGTLPKKCSPHTWMLPNVGDDGIVCTECGRWMDFMNDLALAPYKAHAIVRSMRRRKLAAADTFAERLDEAYEDAAVRFELIHRHRPGRIRLPAG